MMRKSECESEKLIATQATFVHARKIKVWRIALNVLAVEALLHLPVLVVLHLLLLAGIWLGFRIGFLLMLCCAAWVLIVLASQVWPAAITQSGDDLYLESIFGKDKLRNCTLDRLDEETAVLRMPARLLLVPFKIHMLCSVVPQNPEVPKTLSKGRIPE